MTAPLLDPILDVVNRPRVSVVMPTYNRSAFLQQSAGMILAQSLADLELIICDDHSTDDTPEIVAQLAAQDVRVRYHRPAEKGGVTHVLNEACKHSRGDYIQVCHDHDIYFPELTEKLAGVLDRHIEVVFVHPGRQGCDHLGNPLPQAYFVCGYPEVSPGHAWKQRMLRRLASPVTGLSMIRRSALERAGLFDPDFGACSDVELWMRLCEIGDVGYVNELLLYVRGRDETHPYAGVNWEIGDQVIRIHRKHLKRHYQGVSYLGWKIRREMEIDRTLTLDYLNSIRHRRANDVRNGKKYLRDHGVFLSKIIPALL